MTDQIGEPAAAAKHQIGRLERQVRRADRFQQRHGAIGFPLAVMQKFGNDQASGKAALMAYYGLFALFPLLLLLVTGLGFALSGQPQLRASLLNSALRNIPVIGMQLRSDVHPLTGSVPALVIGIIGAIYGAVGLGLAAQNAMNTVWNIPFVFWPNIWLRYLRTLGVIGLLGLSALTSAACAVIATAAHLGLDGRLAAVAASLLLDLGLFLLAFLLLTAEPLRIRDVAQGAAIATVLWQALQYVGTWYVTRELQRAAPTYGFFAVAITLLLWLFLGAQLTLWAAEINVVRRYRLWPRSLTQPPLTEADRRVFKRLAQMEVRRPEVMITTKFTDQADEDPLHHDDQPEGP
jgi:YihY family inner membrane protein